MYAVIAGAKYKKVLQEALKDFNVLFQDFTCHDIDDTFAKINKVSIEVLILQSDVAEVSVLIRHVKILRVLKPNVRIILFAPGAVPGDNLASLMVSKGVYDIYAPKIELENDMLVMQLRDIILSPKANYSIGARWEVEGYSIEDTAKITTIPVTTVVVINMSQNAGSTFIATSLCGVISSYNLMAAFVEIPYKPESYYQFGIYKDDNFYSYPKSISKDKQVESGKEKIKHKIIWLIARPEDGIKSFSHAEMMRLLFISNKANMIVVDAGNHFKDNCIEPLLSTSTMVVAVIDPFPKQLFACKENLDYIKNLQNRGANIKFIVNKYAGYKRDIKEFTGINDFITIPAISLEDMYSASFDLKIPYSSKKIKPVVDSSLEKLIPLLLPADVIRSKPKKKKTKLFWRIGK